MAAKKGKKAAAKAAVGSSIAKEATALAGEVRGLRGRVQGFTILATGAGRSLNAKYVVDSKYLQTAADLL